MSLIPRAYCSITVTIYKIYNKSLEDFRVLEKTNKLYFVLQGHVYICVIFISQRKLQ